MIKVSKLKTPLCILMGCALLSPLAFGEEERPQRGKGGRGGKMGMGKGQLMAGMMVLKKLDTNGDQELSSAEIDAASSVLRGLDKNGDGKVTMDEFGGPGMMGGGKGFGKAGESGSPGEGGKKGPGGASGFIKDVDGDGKITKKDLPEKFQERFAMMDVNKDGELDANEKALVEAKIKDKMGKGLEGGGGKQAKDPFGGPVQPKRPE